MTHEEFIVEVAKRLGWPEEKTAGIIETIREIIAAELKMNNLVAIDQFGTLKTNIYPEYILMIPETKERFLMPPSVEVVFNSLFQADNENPLLKAAFTPDEVLYNELNSLFTQFEPTLLNEGVQFPGILEIVAEAEEEDNTGSHSEFGVEEITLQAGAEQTILPLQKIEPSVRQIQQRSRLGRRLRKDKKISPVWIPIAGGIAIVLASFFFSKGVRVREK